MYKAFILLFISLSSYHTAIIAQILKVGFIKHDSIPMIFTDTITSFSGEKLIAKNLTTKDADYYYAALTPTYPTVCIWMPGYEISPDKRTCIKCFGITNGMIQHCIIYKILVHGDTVLIDSHKKFREIFAPVDSEQEAIAFAYIFTDSKPIYNFDFLKSEAQRPEYRYFELPEEREICLKNRETQIETIMRKDSIKMVYSEEEGWEINRLVISSSYVKKEEDGYMLLLYNTDNMNATYAERLIKVYFDGNVEIVNERAAFRKRREVYYIE